MLLNYFLNQKDVQIPLSNLIFDKIASNKEWIIVSLISLSLALFINFYAGLIFAVVCGISFYSFTIWIEGYALDLTSDTDEFDLKEILNDLEGK